MQQMSLNEDDHNLDRKLEETILEIEQQYS